MPPDDDVVEHSPACVEEVRVLGAAGFDFVKIVGERGVYAVGGIALGKSNGAEVGDIEHCAGVPACKMFANCARILEGHVPASKRSEAGSGREVDLV